jgi:hypothetical protein
MSAATKVLLSTTVSPGHDDGPFFGYIELTNEYIDRVRQKIEWSEKQQYVEGFANLVDVTFGDYSMAYIEQDDPAVWSPEEWASFDEMNFTKNVLILSDAVPPPGGRARTDSAQLVIGRYFARYKARLSQTGAWVDAGFLWPDTLELVRARNLHVEGQYEAFREIIKESLERENGLRTHLTVDGDYPSLFDMVDTIDGPIRGLTRRDIVPLLKHPLVDRKRVRSLLLRIESAS